MSDEIFEIGTGGVDVQEIMRGIRETVERKKKEGFYDRYDLSRVHSINMEEAADEEEFLTYYMHIIRGTCDIDISDFEIHSEGGFIGRIEVMVKKIIWKLMKFYTYRLFSQQKEFNCQAVNAIDTVNKKLDTRVKELEERIEKLEGKKCGPGG